MSSLTGHLASFLPTIFLVLGVVLVLWGAVLLFRKLISPYESASSSWGSIVVLMLFGGVGIAFGPYAIRAIVGSTDDSALEASTTPAPSPSSTPSHAEEAAPADPIVLPEIHNGSTIIIVLTIVTILVVGGIIATKALLGARAAAKRLREEELAREKDRAQARAAWRRVVERHRAVQEKMLHAETDWDVLFSYPAINDPSVPQTKTLLQAHDALGVVSSEPPEGLDLNTDIAALPYPRLVSDLERAWNTAWAHAQKVKMHGIPHSERKQIHQIVRLLHLAESPASTENERELAYSRAQALIAQLVTVKVPVKAAQALESHQRLAITQSAAPITSSRPIRL